MTEVIIPSSPADNEAIYKVMKEISNSKVREQGEKDYQGEAIKDLSEQFGIKSKHLRRMARDYHKNQYDEKVSEEEMYQQLYESIFENNLNNQDDGSD
jgi:Trm5-related predicted tRNA methylase